LKRGDNIEGCARRDDRLPQHGGEGKKTVMGFGERKQMPAKTEEDAGKGLMER